VRFPSVIIGAEMIVERWSGGCKRLGENYAAPPHGLISEYPQHAALDCGPP